MSIASVIETKQVWCVFMTVNCKLFILTKRFSSDFWQKDAACVCCKCCFCWHFNFCSLIVSLMCHVLWWRQIHLYLWRHFRFRSASSRWRLDGAACPDQMNNEMKRHRNRKQEPKYQSLALFVLCLHIIPHEPKAVLLWEVNPKSTKSPNVIKVNPFLLFCLLFICL